MWYPTKIIYTIFVTLITLLFPFTSALNPEFVTKKDDVRLNMEIVSDLHLDPRELLSSSLFKSGVMNMRESTSPIDGLIVPGDITNYGDAASVEYFYKTISKYMPTDNWIVAPGNHDIGHVEDISHDEARDRLIKYYNDYSGSNIEHIYYSRDIKGYTFIVLGDEGPDNWDEATISPEQLAFLDSELARGTANGLPVFVVCHQPLLGTNGQPVVWDEGAIGEDSAKIQAVLEKYKNVFFITGHLHEGANSEVTHKLFGVYCAETINGVNYVNLPAYMYISRYGIPWACMGMQMEVYEDEVLFRTRNYVQEKWLINYEYSFELK